MNRGGKWVYYSKTGKECDLHFVKSSIRASKIILVNEKKQITTLSEKEVAREWRSS